MILDIFRPGFYGRTNQLLIKMAARDVHRLAEAWQDEAAELALAGQPEKAGYVEWCAQELLAT